MRIGLILAGLVFTASAGIKADSLPEGAECRLDYIGGNPATIYVPTDRSRVEDVPALESHKSLYRDHAVGNVGGSATPAFAPDWDTSGPSDE
mgnify:CR=1 FL=1